MRPTCGVEGLSICDVDLLSVGYAAKKSVRDDGEMPGGEMPVLHHGECGPFGECTLCVEYLQRLPCQVPNRLAPAELIA